MTTPTNNGPFYDNKGVAHDTMPIGEETGLPLYRPAPAQPIAPQTEVPQGFIDYVQANYNGVIDIHRPEWHAKRLWNAAMHQIKVAQPIADMSTPSGERAAFEAAMIERHYPASMFDGFLAEGEWAYYDKSANEMHDAWQAARAAAPVSGPSASIGQEDAFIQHLDAYQWNSIEAYVNGGTDKARSLRDKAKADLITFIDSRLIEQAYQEGRKSAHKDDCDIMRDNCHYRERVFNQIVKLDAAEGLHRFARSEGSRAKVLEEAVYACGMIGARAETDLSTVFMCMDAIRVLDTNAALVGKELASDIERGEAIAKTIIGLRDGWATRKDADEALAMLKRFPWPFASTTPPKADNE